MQLGQGEPALTVTCSCRVFPHADGAHRTASPPRSHPPHHPSTPRLPSLPEAEAASSAARCARSRAANTAAAAASCSAASTPSANSWPTCMCISKPARQRVSTVSQGNGVPQIDSRADVASTAHSASPTVCCTLHKGESLRLDGAARSNPQALYPHPAHPPHQPTRASIPGAAS